MNVFVSETLSTLGNYLHQKKQLRRGGTKVYLALLCRYLVNFFN